MAAILIVLGLFLIYPVLLVLLNAFNTAPEVFVGPREWGLDNWRFALQRRGLLGSLGNSILIWGFTFTISLSIGVAISWALARTKIPFSHSIEFMFWISYMMPNIATALGWILLLDPNTGVINTLFKALPFVDKAPFDIFSVPGIVWTHLMSNGIALKVMLLTPAFRNMDASLEEAARTSGASNLRTALRVTLPLMISPIMLVTALQLLRIFQSFEIELLLGAPFNFFVYSTYLYDLVRKEPPLYGQATVLGSLTLIIVAFIIPFQRWILERRRYTTVSGSFRPGLIDLGIWKWPMFGLIMFLIFISIAAPAFVLVLGSFMTRSGYFNVDPVFSTRHWAWALSDPLFIRALGTTMTLAVVAAILSPLLFSVLAYILVRTRWRGRGILDFIIWGSGAVPGILSGLGLLWLFIGTPIISFLFGTIWVLFLVVVLQGNTTGVNVMKGVIVQVGTDMEEAARIAGAGWVRTYFHIWIPLLMPTLVLLSTLNFVIAAGTVSSIILIASRETVTLSLLALEYRLSGKSEEVASIIGIFLMVMTVGLASVLRAFGLRLAVRQDMRATAQAATASSGPRAGGQPGATHG